MYSWLNTTLIIKYHFSFQKKNYFFFKLVFFLNFTQTLIKLNNRHLTIQIKQNLKHQENPQLLSFENEYAMNKPTSVQ